MLFVRVRSCEKGGGASAGSLAQIGVAFVARSVAVSHALERVCRSQRGFRGGALRYYVIVRAWSMHVLPFDIGTSVAGVDTISRN